MLNIIIKRINVMTSNESEVVKIVTIKVRYCRRAFVFCIPDWLNMCNHCAVYSELQ